MDATTLNNQYNSSISNVNNLMAGANSLFDRITNTVEANNAAAAAAADRYNKWSASQAEITREYNSIEAAKNRNWQEMMSNTAHQREVKDLLAAGLNPILSATGGNGASVGSGASASASIASGSKADVDNSASTALVQLFGHQLDTMTKLAESSVSALTASANADKTAAASRFAAQLGYAGTVYSADHSKFGLIAQALEGFSNAFGTTLSDLPGNIVGGIKSFIDSFVSGLKGDWTGGGGPAGSNRKWYGGGGAHGSSSAEKSSKKMSAQQLEDFRKLAGISDQLPKDAHSNLIYDLYDLIYNSNRPR